MSEKADELKPGESIIVSHTAHGWSVTVQHGNGGDTRPVASREEAWKKGREILAWHRAHPIKQVEWSLRGARQ